MIESYISVISHCDKPLICTFMLSAYDSMTLWLYDSRIHVPFDHVSHIEWVMAHTSTSRYDSRIHVPYDCTALCLTHTCASERPIAFVSESCLTYRVSHVTHIERVMSHTSTNRYDSRISLHLRMPQWASHVTCRGAICHMTKNVWGITFLEKRHTHPRTNICHTHPRTNISCHMSRCNMSYD